MGFVPLLLSSLMRYANTRVFYGLMVFVCLHITLPHYHHYADASESIELLKLLVRYILSSVSKIKSIWRFKMADPGMHLMGNQLMPVGPELGLQYCCKWTYEYVNVFDCNRCQNIIAGLFQLSLIQFMVPCVPISLSVMIVRMWVLYLIIIIKSEV